MTPVHTFRVFIVALALVIAQAVLQPAAADQLDELRAQGQIGERFDGAVKVRERRFGLTSEQLKPASESSEPR